MSRVAKKLAVLLFSVFASLASAHELAPSTAIVGPATTVNLVIKDSATGAVKTYANRVAAPKLKTTALATAVAPVTISGTLIIVHFDNFVKDEAQDYLAVIENNNASAIPTRLEISTFPDMLAPGQQVIVSGTSPTMMTASKGPTQKVLLPSSITIMRSMKVSGPLALGAPVTKKLLVVPVKPASVVAEPWTKAFDDAIFVQVAAWFNQVSYGQLSFTVTVAPWQNTTLLTTDTSCNTFTVQQDAEAGAKAAGYDPATYDNVLFHQSNIGGCGWLGLAYVGWGRAWINGGQTFGGGAFTHELGHNIGLLHAGSLTCAAANVNWDFTQCPAAEYGDFWSNMGNHGTWNYNSAQKLIISFIDPTSVQTHAAADPAKTYSISSLSLPLPTGGTYAVKVLTPLAKRVYWLEYRTPNGVDAGNPAGLAKPAQIRVGTPLEVTSGSDDTQTVARPG